MSGETNMCIVFNTCSNCHWQQVDRKKASELPCSTCCHKTERKASFLNWKAIEKVKP